MSRIHIKCPQLYKTLVTIADDTAIINVLESDNQYLLNLFTKWCSWSDLIVKISKCVTFGTKKSSTPAVQFEPHLMISNQKKPTVKKGESFKYLGTSFNFGMNLYQIKEELERKFEKYLYEIARLPLKPLDKIRIVNTYVYSKIKWEFSIDNYQQHGLSNT